MRFRLLTTAAIAVMFALAGASSATAVTDIPATPSRNSPIVDTVGALLDSDIAELAATITDGDLNTGDRTSVLIIPTTDGEPIASYAHRVATAWSLTSPTEKNVLIVVAMSDHTLRIDLSPALQADISDASAQAIGDDFMSPAFKDGDILGGLDFGISALQAAGTGQSFDPDQTDGEIPDIYTANGEVVTGDGSPFFPDATLSQSPDMVGLTGLVGGFFVLVIIAIVVTVIMRLVGRTPADPPSATRAATSGRTVRWPDTSAPWRWDPTSAPITTGASVTRSTATPTPAASARAPERRPVATSECRAARAACPAARTAGPAAEAPTADPPADQPRAGSSSASAHHAVTATDPRGNRYKPSASSEASILRAISA
nr:TPM domain-containing protein [Glaciihabitans sp. dw_435]